MIKQLYQAPEVELLTVVVEHGFATSGDFTLPDGGTNGGESDNWA